MLLCTVPHIVWEAPTSPWATIGCKSHTVEAPVLPVKGSLDMQSDSLITVFSFCFLSDSPLDSHVNMRTCSWYRLWSALEVVPSRPKGWLPLSLRVRSKSHFISGWRYCVVVSDLWAGRGTWVSSWNVLKMVEHVDKQSLYSLPEYLPFLEHKFDFGSSLPLVALPESSFHRKERDSQVMVGESHESVRWSCYSPRPVFVFAALSQCVSVCSTTEQYYIKKRLVFYFSQFSSVM